MSSDIFGKGPFSPDPLGEDPESSTMVYSSLENLVLKARSDRDQEVVPTECFANV